MKTHYIYNKKTGQILHVHISDEGQDVSREGILHKINSPLKKNELDILTTDKMIEGEFLEIDLTKKLIIKAKSKNKSQPGFGFSEQSSEEFTALPATKKTVYKNTK